MAELKQKIKLSLDEARMLVLGAQILLGFEYRIFLEPTFDELPRVVQLVRLGGLGAILLTTMLLMWPAAYQQITEAGDATPALHDFTTKVMCYALLPFAAAIGIDVYTVSAKVGGNRIGMPLGIATAATALFFWYLLEYLKRRPREHLMDESNQPNKTPLHDRIDDVLTECRVVIPGAQALLGFQLIAMFMQGFEKLPRISQYVHLASLLLMALSMILLMTPAAYHRIVERGEDTVRFWRHARVMLLSAMVPLAAGLAAESYVVIAKVTASRPVAIAAAAAMLACCYGCWFLFTFYKRSRAAAAHQHDQKRLLHALSR